MDTKRRLNRLGAWFYTRFPAAGRRWAQQFQPAATAPTIPWAPLDRPLAQTKFALITTGGPHLRRDQPFDMADPHGDPSYRAIPAQTPLSAITITHDYYNHADADRDLNIILPLTRFQELVERGDIGGLGTAYGFMGHITDEHIATLISQTAPAVARSMRAEGVTAALLTPA
jgi:D-proline reductase (dithiol) PrdB